MTPSKIRKFKVAVLAVRSSCNLESGESRFTTIDHRLSTKFKWRVIWRVVQDRSRIISRIIVESDFQVDALNCIRLPAPTCSLVRRHPLACSWPHPTNCTNRRSYKFTERFRKLYLCAAKFSSNSIFRVQINSSWTVNRSLCEVCAFYTDNHSTDNRTATLLHRPVCAFQCGDYHCDRLKRLTRDSHLVHIPIARRINGTRIRHTPTAA